MYDTKYKINEKNPSNDMWMCRMLVKVLTELTEGIYDLHVISFIVSTGSIRESLELIEMLDEDDQLS